MNGVSAVIRCDASPAIGLGHVMRCRALAAALRDAGGSVTFVTRAAAWVDDEPDAVLVDGSAKLDVADADIVVEVAKARGANWSIVDHYGADERYLEALASRGPALAMIDDRADRDLSSASWVLNQNLSAVRLRYRVAADCRLVLGVRYALLRRRFVEARAALTRRFDRGDRRVLVTFGGGDTVDLARETLASLRYGGRRLDLRVILAGGDDAPLRREARTVPHEVSILREIPNVDEQMAWADLSLNAGGSTCWELLCLGVPMIVTSLSPDQRLNPLPLEEAGVARAVPRDEIGSVGSIVDALLSDPDERSEMSRKGMALVDGHGAERAAASLAVSAKERLDAVR